MGVNLIIFRFCVFILQVHNAFKIRVTEMFRCWGELPTKLKLLFRSLLEGCSGLAVTLSLANQSIFTAIFAF